MSLQFSLSPCEQALTAAQQVPVACLSLPERLYTALVQAQLLTLDQVLDLTHRDAALQLQFDEVDVSQLFASLAAYFERQALPWLYPLLPPRCVTKPLDVLVLASGVSGYLQAEGHERLGTLAVLPPTSPFAAEVQAALQAYVDTFRRTTIHYQQRTLSIQGLPGPTTPPPGLPLNDLALPVALKTHLERLGVKTLSPQASAAELALVWGLPPAWSEELYRALQKAKLQALSLPPVIAPFHRSPGVDPILPVLDTTMLEGILAAAGYPGLSLSDAEGVAALRRLLPQPLSTLVYFRRYLPEWLALTQLHTLEQLLRALLAFYQQQASPPPAPSAALLAILPQVLPPLSTRRRRSCWRDFFRLGSRV